MSNSNTDMKAVMPATLTAASLPRNAPLFLESFGHDGILVARRHHRKPGRRLPLRQLLQLALVVMSFKVFLFLQLGNAAYNAKIDTLMQGGLAERVAARVMVFDPASAWLVNAAHSSGLVASVRVLSSL